MEQKTAKWMWNNACMETVGSDTERNTALGHMMVALDIPTQAPMGFIKEWGKIATFLRLWADAMDKEVEIELHE